MLAWISANWQTVLGLFTTVMTVAVGVAHLVHRDDVAAKIQTLEDGIASLTKK